jgi:hypothetical protein
MRPFFFRLFKVIEAYSDKCVFRRIAFMLFRIFFDRLGNQAKPDGLVSEAGRILVSAVVKLGNQPKIWSN